MTRALGQAVALVAIFSTTGNDDCHIILRGGKQPNYDAESIEQACKELRMAELPELVMVDCSHANSRKDPKRQVDVARSLAEQISGGDRRIMGAMLESHLVGGRQDILPGKPLTYGQSITDACMGWDETETSLNLLADAVRARRKIAEPA